MKLYHYTGAGNDFLIADGRHCDCSALKAAECIVELCRRHGTDGLMVLEDAPGYDFGMAFFNPDGSGGMMCGNGGRCIVAFARDLGVVGESCIFLAPDGVHEASVLSDDGALKTVRLKMKDVCGIDDYPDGCFLDTGTRHFVRIVPDVEALDVEAEGKLVRHRADFAPQGTNVNFVQPHEGRLLVRTFEKGVEGETLACGTGIVASALSAYHKGIAPSEVLKAEVGLSRDSQSSASGASCVLQSGGPEAVRVRYDVTARRGDSLAVDFVPLGLRPFSATSVYLTGPAEALGEFYEDIE